MFPVPTRIAKRIPASEPPAMSPELNKIPELSSDSSGLPLLRSTHARTRPPAKIGAVVAIGRYEPTAKDRDRIPHDTSAIERNTQITTNPHGRFWLRSPLMIVAINVACGAARSLDPMPPRLL